MRKTVLHFDLETYSSVDLGGCGVYKYCESPDFKILLLAYAFDNEPVRIIDLEHGETIPRQVVNALSSPDVEKWAHNVNFERTCLSAHFDTQFAPEGWKCTQIKAAYNGYPKSLKALGEALELVDGKLESGTKLINLFCKPRDKEPSKAASAKRPQQWREFKDYCIRDVEVERNADKILKEVPEFVWEEFWRDCRMNDRGILVDLDFVKAAKDLADSSIAAMIQEIQDISGIENPQSVQQLKEWVISQGVEITSTAKGELEKVVKREDLPDNVKRVIQLRLESAKSSLKKYDKILDVCGLDGRIRGLIQFYGAGTGRAAGRLVQVQNLPQNKMMDLLEARELVKQRKVEVLESLYDDVPDTLSQLIRTSFKAPEGKKFIVLDFTSIEAIVLAWLAGEKDIIRAYNNKEDLYKANAVNMFGLKSQDEVTKELRQKSKVAVLACGFQGSVGALKAFGAVDKLGMSEESLPGIVKSWRNANKNIVDFWYRSSDAAIQAVYNKGDKFQVGYCTFSYDGSALSILLPSGRGLKYVNAHIGQNPWGNETVCYSKPLSVFVETQGSGGKFVENIAQAVARDILYHALSKFQGEVVASVHDEVVLEVPENAVFENYKTAMEEMPLWAKDWTIRADGFETKYYMKD